MKTVFVLNGPNLGRLGKREPEVYGSASHDDLVAACEQEGGALGLAVEVRQTDDEATYLGWIHEAADRGIDALVLNPAAWTHTSVAVRDAAAGLSVPYVEVHLSNPAARGRISDAGRVCRSVVTGFGIFGYFLALRGLKEILAKR